MSAMKNRMLLVLFALMGLVQMARSQCLTAEDTRNKIRVGNSEDLVQSRLDFSLKLLKTISNNQPSDNIFISPLSLFNALLLAYFTSAGHTENSLKNALFLPKNQSKFDLLLSYRIQRHLINNGEYKSQVNTANRLFLSVNQTVKDCMEEIFGDEIHKMDFSGENLIRSLKYINDWVANQTSNNILDLLSTDSVNPRTQLILVNAAYFKGLWKIEFDKNKSFLAMFHAENNKLVSVMMMTQLEVFSHWRSEELKAEALEMPYKGDEISMIVLLPDPSDSTHPVADLINRLTSSRLKEIISKLRDSQNKEEIEVAIPTFTVERTVELTPILEEMGVGDLFHSTSDLTGLTGGPRIQLNSAVHKAKIRLDEHGTEAAAATAILDTRMSSAGYAFFCNRPFMYLIYDKVRTTLLFAGVYNDPSKN